MAYFLTDGYKMMRRGQKLPDPSKCGEFDVRKVVVSSALDDAIEYQSQGLDEAQAMLMR